MEKVLDLHIHSKYSRACSPALTLENIDKACREKGVDIVATGDFTYPQWFSSIENELEDVGDDSGLYRLKKKEDAKVKFMLATELALVYKKFEQARRLHIMVNAPDIKSARELNVYLDKKFNIRSDGRPILGLSVEDLMDICFKIHPDFLVYPAHIWTPWFAIFGSKSGFNSLEEAFGRQVENIYAYETGLSSDPEMNWRISELDKLTCLSNSDAHSPSNIAREANVFDLKKETYKEIYTIIKNKDLEKQKFTIEFYPEEGMYHLDGHRDCDVSFEPEETKRNKGLCPVCKRPLVVGVMNRVEELADRPKGETPEEAVGFKKLVELDKIVAETMGIKSRNSKKVKQEYYRLLKIFGPELKILLSISADDLAHENKLVAEGVRRVRAGELQINPGFDGRYGEIKIFDKKEFEGQARLI